MPLCGTKPSETPHRERPGKRIGDRRRRRQAGRTALFLVYVAKGVDQQTISIRN